MTRLFVNKHLDRKILALFLVCLSISSLTVFELMQVTALPADSNTSSIEPGSLNQAYDYIAYQDSGKFLAIDGKAGGNAFKESTATALWTDIVVSGKTSFWKAGTYTLCVNILDINNVAISGQYPNTIFSCNLAAGVTINIGNPNAVDTVYHAQNVTLRDLVLDGSSISNSACLGITTAFNVYVTHVMLRNCFELGNGCFRMTNWNSNQILSKNIYIRDSQFYNCKMTLSGTVNGYIRDSSYIGLTPGAVGAKVLIDFSKGDIVPTAVNNLGNFCFCGNTISGWTLGIFAGFQAISNDTIGGNTIRDASNFLQTTDTSGGIYFEGIRISDNYYSSATGGITFGYGHSITIENNIISFDTSPSTGTTAISLDKAADPLVNQTPRDIVISNNEIYKWGGIGMTLNFLNGNVQNNEIYDVNQKGGVITSLVGMLLNSNLANTLISGNTIISDQASGAGESVPINYNGAGNVTVSNNYFAYKGGANLLGNAVFYSSTPGISFQAYGNAGYNPVPKLTNFIVSGGIGLCGTGTTPVSTTVYTVCGFPIIWTCTGGTVTAIAEQDNNGNQIFSVANCAALPAIGVYSPIAYKIVFTFSVAPTITVFGA